VPLIIAEFHRVGGSHDETRFAYCYNRRFVAALRSASAKALVVEILKVIFNRSHQADEDYAVIDYDS
jgi:hypothetical protein